MRSRETTGVPTKLTTPKRTGALAKRVLVFILVAAGVLVLVAPSSQPVEPTYTATPLELRDVETEGGSLTSRAPSWEEGSASGIDSRYSTVHCIEGASQGGGGTFEGSAHQYGFNIVNRSCFYTNVLFKFPREFYIFVPDTPQNRQLHRAGKLVPPVTLASRPYDLPAVNKAKQRILRAKIGWTYGWRPSVIFGPIPPVVASSGEKPPQTQAAESSEEMPQTSAAVPTGGVAPLSISGVDDSVIGYYTPIVAPWNYAHTLYCDLFGLFWAAFEFISGEGGVRMSEYHLYFPSKAGAGSGGGAVGLKGAPAARDLSAKILGRRTVGGGLGVRLDLRVVATSSHYDKEYPLPNKNKAFEMFSRKPAIYDHGLRHNTLYRGLLAGAGTKSWSWVTSRYAASGDGALWASFRTHLIDVVGATDRGTNDTTAIPRRLRVSICHKKDKRGVINYEEAEIGLRKHFERTQQPVDVALEAAVGRSAKEQVQMMVDADVFVCNEGTLATSFFLMPRGSAFVSLPLVYHGPHLHRIEGLPKAEHWWRQPDLLRPDPRLNQGGNIDWFPQSIPWVRTFWYDYVPLNETRIQLPLRSLRNYMPDYNIKLNINDRLVPLLDKVVGYLHTQNSLLGESERRLSGVSFDGETTKLKGMHPLLWREVFEFREALLAGRRDGHLDLKGLCRGSPLRNLPVTVDDEDHNYSINGRLCKDMLLASPEWTAAFNSAKCFYGMSWLCELWSNTRYNSRNYHGKWALSKGRCGGSKATVEYAESVLQVQHASLLGGAPLQLDPRLHWHTPRKTTATTTGAFGENPALRRYHLWTRFSVKDEEDFLLKLEGACGGSSHPRLIPLRELFNLATNPFLFSSFPMSSGPRDMEDFLFFAPSAMPAIFNTTDMRVPVVASTELDRLFGPYTNYAPDKTVL